MTINIQKPDQRLVITGIISILLLLLLASLSGSSFVLGLFSLSAINGTILFLSRMLYWICLLLLWLYSTKIEKQRLLIWEEKKYPFLMYVASIIAIFIALFVGLVIIQRLLLLTDFNRQSSKLTEIVDILRGNMALLIFTSLTAAVTEELIFRGYLQPRLTFIFKNPYIAIIVSSLLFGLLHYRYGTFINVIGPVFIGLVFAFYYWKYRNIKVVIVCHFLWDLISLLAQVKTH